MDVASAIESELGAGCLVDGPGALKVDGRTPVTAAPAGVEEMAELVRLAAARGWVLVPAGHGTWLDVGNQAKAVDVVASTRRLTTPLSPRPEDLLATVGAGIGLDDLNDTLAQAHQWWPLDPLGRGTLGASIATASAGPLATGYGTPRDLVLGLSVLGSDGRLIRAGGRVVKNVAGYDMTRLFTGSWGTLGIVVEVHLRLHPLPAADRTLGLAGPEASALADLARSLGLDGKLMPAAVELVSPPVAALLGDMDSGWLLALRWLGGARAVEDAAGAVAGAAGELGLRPVELDSVWQDYRVIEERLQPAVTLRLDAPPRALTELADAVVEFADVESLPLAVAPITGRLWAFLPEPVYRKTGLAAWITRLERLRMTAAAAGGYVRIESAPLELRSRVNVWGNAGATLPLQRTLKSKFDPEGIFNRGRVVGGM